MSKYRCDRRSKRVLVCLAIFGMAAFLLAFSPAIASAQSRNWCNDCQTSRNCPTGCACDGIPPPIDSSQMPSTDDSIMIDPGLDNSAINAPPPAMDTLLASSFGASFGAMSSTPNMMGDLFGAPGTGSMVARLFVCNADNLGNLQLFCASDMRTFQDRNGLSFDAAGQDTNGDGTIDFLPDLVEVGSGMFNGQFVGVATSFVDNSGGGQDISTADIFQQVFIDDAGPGTGIILGRLKIAENNSPLPRDRAFVNYSHFTNVPLFPGGVNVNRVTPGFEKTFHDGQMSFEFRFPFGTSLDDDITADGITSTNELLVGNMMIVYKALLLAESNWALTGGVGFTMPTARDVRVGLTDGTELVRIHNDAIHISPYVAYLATPNNRCFFQVFLQAELDANGNLVEAQGSSGMEGIGRVNDTNYLYFDVGAGYYLYRDRYDRMISSIAPMAELHWNKTLQPTDVVRSGGVQIGNEAQNVDILNGVVGLNMVLGTSTHVTVGYTVPIGGGDNAQFDGEFRLLVNRFFGR